jgi:hypothetical protein
MTTTATWTASAVPGSPRQQQQLISHQLLTSFPVEDLDLLELLDDTSNSSSSIEGVGQDGQTGAAGVEGGAGADVAGEGPNPGRALSALQAAVGGCVGLMQQLMLPHALFEQQQQQRSGSRRGGWLVMRVGCSRAGCSCMVRMQFATGLALLPYPGIMLTLQLP